MAGDRPTNHHILTAKVIPIAWIDTGASGWRNCDADVVRSVSTDPNDEPNLPNVLKPAGRGRIGDS
jgi:hypothetical protein